MSGYLMQRGWMEHDLFNDEPFTKAMAWEWMISEAAWKETRKRINGKPVTLQRGQLSHSIRFLADKWKWHRSRVERFIAILSSEGMIETDSETGQLITTICNYANYQLKPSGKKTPTETPARQQRDKEEEGNKEINKKERGTRFALSALPDDWKDECRKLRPDLDPEATFAAFSDYWIATPGSKGVKLDWLATWRNWCRNDHGKPKVVPKGAAPMPIAATVDPNRVITAKEYDFAKRIGITTANSKFYQAQIEQYEKQQGSHA